MNKKMSLLFIAVLCFAAAQIQAVRVYVDIVGDLFHAGHINFFKQAREFGDYLIVGIHNDEDCTGYKRQPILTLEERAASISACRYVDEVILNAPLSPTAEYIKEHEIDIVVHGDDFNEATIRKFYGEVIDLGIFRTVPYTPGVSTSDIIRRVLSRTKKELFRD